MSSHLYKKHLMTICKSALAVVSAVIPGIVPILSYAEDSNVAQEEVQQKALLDPTAPSFFPKLILSKAAEILSDSALKSGEYIEAYHVSANVFGMYAQIETEITIRNLNTFPIAGNVLLPIPEGAGVTGYAMDVTNQTLKHEMVDAVAVSPRFLISRQEEFKDKQLDSENTDNNVFNVYIDSILPRGYRKIRISYTMPLKPGTDGTSSVLLPTKKSTLQPRSVKMSVDIPGIGMPNLNDSFGSEFEKEGDVWVFEHTDKRITPKNDLVLSIPALPDGTIKYLEMDSTNPNQIFEDEVFYHASIKIDNKALPARDLSRLRLIWDASGSRTPEDVQKSIEVLKRLPQNSQYELHVFRNVTEPVVTFNSRDELIHHLESVYYDGPTDYRSLESIAKEEYQGITLFFTEGLDSFDNSLPVFGLQSTAIMSGKMYDRRELWNACHGHVVNLNIQNPDEAVSEIRIPRLLIYKVTGKNVMVQVNLGVGKPVTDRITVTGLLHELPDGEDTDLTITLTDGREYHVNLSNNDKIHEGTLLSKAWASQSILDPNSYFSPAYYAHHYSVASPDTELVVLDSELENYNRYKWSANEVNITFNKAYKKKKGVNKSKKKLAKDVLQVNDSSDNENKIPDDLWDEEWSELQKWYKNPIPKGIKNTYHCSAQDKKNCTVTVSSELGEHYTTSYNPPSNWTCKEKLNCYLDLEDDFGLGAWGITSFTPRIAYGPPTPLDLSNYVLSSASYHPNISSVPLDVQNKSPEPMTWDPETPYLTELKELRTKNADDASMFAEYLHLKSKYIYNSSFYFDVADYFYSEKMNAYANRILSNLFELRLGYEERSVFDQYIKRLIYAGELDEAVNVIELRRAKGENRNSELAQVLDMRARKNINAEDAEKALNLYVQTGSDFEEFISLMNWTKNQKWKQNKPVIPAIGKRFKEPIHSDLRIVIDFDEESSSLSDRIRITEPTTEVISGYWSHSAKGGILENKRYLIKKADKGQYIVSLYRIPKLYEQYLFGKEYIYVKIYRNWGKPDQSMEIIAKHIEVLPPDNKSEDKVANEDRMEINDKTPVDQITVIEIK